MERKYNLEHYLKRYRRAEYFFWNFAMFLISVYNLETIVRSFLQLYLTGRYGYLLLVRIYTPFPYDGKLLVYLCYFTLGSITGAWIAVIIAATDLYLLGCVLQLCLHFELLTKQLMELDTRILTESEAIKKLNAIAKYQTTTTAGANPPRTLQKFQNCIAFLIPSWHNLTQKKSTQVDAIDCFTNELVLRRCKKWEELKENVCQSLNQKDSSVSCSTTNLRESMHMMSKAIKTDFEALRSPKLVLDIRSLSQAQLDNLLISTVEIKNKLDFLYLVQQCIRWQYLPSNEVLIASLKYLSTLSAVQQIESFLEICKQQKHPLLEAYTDFAPFKAMALWRHGRSDMALTTLHQGYDKALQALHHQALHGHHQELLQHIQGYDSSNLMASNGNGKRMIRAAFRTIIEETLIKKSDAV
ncbi:uncharacterized protein LOC119644440, partial [Glossina fuscipes]|uniref:Uncharacterized protein LOC119644432 n=1 Tax=Glossina fuscipes TaxID=7396 RepID=A0A9C5ZDV1_9MUSC